jgi:hypothetical protein
MNIRQRGNVYLEFALLAFALLIAGVFLIKVHELFILLVPAAALVFFLPNLMGFFGSQGAGKRFKERLAALPGVNAQSVTVLRNEFGGAEAQAVWFDAAARTLGLIYEYGDESVRSWDALERVRAIHVEQTYATSFHRGKIKIPARYVLIFEFNGAVKIELVTRKKRVMDEWIGLWQARGAGKLEYDGSFVPAMKS